MDLPNVQGYVVSMEQQVALFEVVQAVITLQPGHHASAEFFAKSLFFMSVGSNDIFDHHDYNETTVSQPELMAALQSNYTAQLTALYDLGAWKFGIVSVPPIGCCPYARLQNLKANRSGCFAELNNYARSFHSMISALLQNLSSQLQGMVYSLGDAYTMTSTLMDDHLAVGIDNIEEACCGRGTLNAEKPCFTNDIPNLCPNRSDHLFWDMFHLTEYVAQKAAITLFTGGPTFVALMNFSQLAWASA
ncbi:GDSL esterase/lipase At1g33811-like [Rhodamnia argentea]|uniref:GDSL esterase/lipase At1g33811-like n=1 Tax=Rhodamnia argentea TaxID=178133 RepID=A0A8B8NQ14_9MYRT|nr:GDSL esterase/lipase At1g33811-like [Rhodamnia argentea]